MGHSEGHAFLSSERRSEIQHQTNWTGHAEGCACLSSERRSEKRQTNQTRNAEVSRLSEEQHAENGVHHLNLILLNYLSSNLYVLSLITLQDK
jgi:hypothetical protein